MIDCSKKTNKKKGLKAYLAGYMVRNPLYSRSKGGTITTWPLLQQLKHLNTCRGQDHGLQQVRERDDALDHVGLVHQDQAMDLQGAG